jgi:hypothetical protein
MQALAERVIDRDKLLIFQILRGVSQPRPEGSIRWKTAGLLCGNLLLGHGDQDRRRDLFG